MSSSKRKFSSIANEELVSSYEYSIKKREGLINHHLGKIDTYFREIIQYDQDNEKAYQAIKEREQQIAININSIKKREENIEKEKFKIAEIKYKIETLQDMENLKAANKFIAGMGEEALSFRSEEALSFRSGEALSFRSGENLSFRSGENLSFRSEDALSFRSEDALSFRSGENLSFISGENLSFRSEEALSFRSDQFLSMFRVKNPEFIAPSKNIEKFFRFLTKAKHNFSPYNIIKSRNCAFPNCKKSNTAVLNGGISIYCLQCNNYISANMTKSEIDICVDKWSRLPDNFSDYYRV